jgi:hypothetical protein
MSKKRKPKNNYIRKTNRKRRKTTRPRRKTTRTRRKTTRVRRNKLSGLLSGGGGGDGPITKVPNRIGFELEACFRQEVGDPRASRPAPDEWGFGPPPPYETCGDPWWEDTFTPALKHFDRHPDMSIKCKLGGEFPPCRQELVLTGDGVFTYNDKQIYRDGEDITSSLIDEISLISSRIEPCLPGSCGFHVHISATEEKYGLDEKEGKIFLLRFLALWCGIEGQEMESEQSIFIDKGYVRSDADEYATLLEPLDRKDFKAVYNLALGGQLDNEGLITYIIRVYTQISAVSRRWEVETRLRSINIYFFGMMGQFKGNIPEVLARSAGNSHKLNDVKNRQMAAIFKQPLRIEFRGHGDLIEKLMDTDTSSPTESSVHAITGMMHSYDPEKSRNLAKASRFHDHLMTYLEDIDSLFERAKTYEPPI